MRLQHAIRKGVLCWAAALLTGLLAATASAGPQIPFGPDNQGVLQIDYKGQFQMIMRDTGSGPNETDTTSQFNMRRNRLAFMGSYGDVIGFYVQTEYAEQQDIGPLDVRTDAAPSEFQILDSVIRFDFSDIFRVNVGKFKYNLSRENLEACEAELTLDRSLFIRTAFVRTRDTGVAVWGNIHGGLFQYRFDVMDGRLPTTDSAPEPASKFRYSARAHVSLLDPENTYGYKGTFLGEKKVLTIGGAVQQESEVAYGDTVNKTDVKDYKAWTADLFFEYPLPTIGTVTVSAAYEEVDLGNAYQGANPDPGTIDLYGEKNGYYVKAAYLLPQTPLQIYVRYEDWQFASLNNVVNQEVKWTGVGLNYYFDKQNLKLTVEYSKTDYGTEGTFGGIVSKDFNTLVTQLQVVF